MSVIKSLLIGTFAIHHMKKLLLLLLFLITCGFAKAQLQFVTCVDSAYVNPYYTCYDDYYPVCGCDGITYRSICAAYNKGGLLYAPSPYTDGPCGNFDIDFVPNVIVPGSLENGVGKLSYYTRTGPVSALIQIYDTFGRVWYKQQQTLNAGLYLNAFDITMNGFPEGLYYLFVIIDGEAKNLKIIKADLR